LLGAGHPLVGLLCQCNTVFEQVVSVAAVQAAAGLVFLSGDSSFALLLSIAGVVVQLGLGCRLAALKASRRQLCLELIIEGHGGLPLACTERECRRLLDPRNLEQLATSIEQILEIAAQPLARPSCARPLFDVRVIRRVVPELREIVSLLRDDGAAVSGIAAVERLLTSAATPLYASQVEPLRQELGRARYLLSSTP
jgi:hypothetical protein